MRNSKEAYKRAKKKNRQKAQLYFRHILNRGGFEYEFGIQLEISWKSTSSNIGFDNRETETNHNNESPTFDEEREDREIRENMRIMSISSRPILLTNFHVRTFHHMLMWLTINAIE